MKKSMLFLMVICLISATQVNAQVGQQPEPKCACDQPELIFDLGGNLKLMYSEITISMKDDGSILVKDIITTNYYIVKDGNTQGPIKAGDPRLAGFDNPDDRDMPKESTRWANNEYISKSGEKYQIKFGGKTYGPYGEINEFQVTKSKEKFAAIVTENVIMNEAEGKKIEEAIKNAKTDQERMDLSMKYSQMMMQKMQQGGGLNSMQPKIVTNIPNATYDMMKAAGGKLNGSIKYDDILLLSYDKIIDLQMKTVLTLNQDAVGAKDLFVNTANTKYAFYNYGTLTFNDGTIMSEMFNLRWVKVNGQISLAYMYYSPKRNAIMQCKMAF